MRTLHQFWRSFKLESIGGKKMSAQYSDKLEKETTGFTTVTITKSPAHFDYIKEKLDSMIEQIYTAYTMISKQS